VPNDEVDYMLAEQRRVDLVETSNLIQNPTISIHRRSLKGEEGDGHVNFVK